MDNINALPAGYVLESDKMSYRIERVLGHGGFGITYLAWAMVNVVIPFRYDNARWFSEGLAAVKQNDTWGFVDKSGNVVIPFKYDDAYSFKNGVVEVMYNGRWMEMKIGKEGKSLTELDLFLSDLNL